MPQIFLSILSGCCLDSILMSRTFSNFCLFLVFLVTQNFSHYRGSINQFHAIFTTYLPTGTVNVALIVPFSPRADTSQTLFRSLQSQASLKFHIFLKDSKKISLEIRNKHTCRHLFRAKSVCSNCNSYIRSQCLLLFLFLISSLLDFNRNFRQTLIFLKNSHENSQPYLFNCYETSFISQATTQRY